MDNKELGYVYILTNPSFRNHSAGSRDQKIDR
jgi:hypothetical protein